MKPFPIHTTFQLKIINKWLNSNLTCITSIGAGYPGAREKRISKQNKVIYLCICYYEKCYITTQVCCLVIIKLCFNGWPNL
jgi:hypothetical protein